MEFVSATPWWIATGIVVIAELATGSFYLLMIGLGLAAGALAAGWGLAVTLQLVLAAVVACIATGLLHWRRTVRARAMPASANPDLNLDIGQEVHVSAWGPDHTTRVNYRGSTWSARPAPGVIETPGTYRVSAVEGNWLVLSAA